MEEDDEEFEQLLGEIPRATSAPPHLEELQRVHGSSDTVFQSQYEDFYKRFLPLLPEASPNPDLSTLSTKSTVNQNSSFYTDLALDSPPPSLQQLQFLEMDLKLQQQEQEHHGVSQNHLDDPLLAGRFLGSEQTLSSAIAALNIKGNSLSTVQQNGDERVRNGDNISGVSDLYSHVGAFASGSASYGPVTEGILDTFLNRSEPLGCFANRASCVEASKQRAFPGIENLTSCLSDHALGLMLRKGSPVQEGFPTGYASELDASAYYQKQLQQVDGFSVGATAMQPAQPVRNDSGHLTELYASSLQHQAPNHFGVSSFEAQHRFHQAAASQQLDHSHVVQQIQDERALNGQQTQQQYFMRHLKQLQEEQLHTYLYGQNQLTSGEFVPNISKGFPFQSGSHDLPFPIGLSTTHHGLYRKSQQAGSMPNMGCIQQQPQEAPLNLFGYAPFSQSDNLCRLSDNLCRFYAQGYCSRGNDCRFVHIPSEAGIILGGSKDLRMSTSLPGDVKSPLHGEKHLARRSSRGANVTANVSGMRKKVSANGQNKLLADANGNQLFGHFSMNMQDYMSNELSELQLQRHATSPWVPHHQQQIKYTSLQDVEGRIFTIAKDQHGCRFLQRKFDEGDPSEMQKIFLEIIDHIIELMTDPFGNYLVQKLLDVCNDVQHMKILHAVTVKGELVAISLNMHGTRAVQKLIETLNSPDQIAMVVSSLRQGVVTLIKDLNGNHVVQRCLQRLSNEDNEFIFDAASSNCVEIATHRHGCCVLQRCVDFSSGTQHQRLLAEIAANALVLSQDQYGNYVVQYVLDLAIPWALVEVMVRLVGSYAFLSMQKFSSNVVEKCLKLADDEHRSRIVDELMSSSVLGQLLQDPFANYVVQCALTVTKGTLHTNLVEAIRPHLPTLRSSPFGKRILSRTSLKR